MLLLNTSFGKYASMPLGWIFMFLLLVLEAFIMSKALKKQRGYDFGVMASTAVSNVVSGALGAYISKLIDHGWMLVVWFPWVSSIEVDTVDTETLFSFVLYFVAAFLGTVFVEIIINGVLIRRYSFKDVMKSTIVANVISYMIGCLALYTYSFLFYD